MIATRFTREQKGQASMEAVLIMVVLVVLFAKISSVAKDQGFLAKIVEGPWSMVRGMIEDGVWEKQASSKALNPNHKKRHQSTKGDAT